LPSSPDGTGLQTKRTLSSSQRIRTCRKKQAMTPGQAPLLPESQLIKISQRSNCMEDVAAIDWNQVVGKEARGARDDGDFGEMQEAGRHYVVTQEGYLKRKSSTSRNTSYTALTVIRSGSTSRRTSSGSSSATCRRPTKNTPPTGRKARRQTSKTGSRASTRDKKTQLFKINIT